MAFGDFFYRKFESYLIRNGRLAIADSANVSYDGMNDKEMLELISKLREVAQDRKTRISEYNEMITDGITLSAAELFAEDATQFDEDKGHIVWIRSADRDFEDSINAYLHKALKIDSMMFAIALNVVVYGECYLNTFKSDPFYVKAGNKPGDYMEIEKPDFVSHIYQFGKPAGYHVTSENKFSSRTITDQILSEKDFIHFIADQSLNREKIQIKVQNAKQEESEIPYTVRYGTSFLEAARSYYKNRVLLDNILILSRLTRSQFYRLFSIEVGNADSVETDRIIKEVRDAIGLSRSFDPNSGQLSSVASPMSTGGNVYIPTRDGRGSTKVETSGGDTDVRAILDIDHFDNQYYGALKVPKQFLGCSDEMPGGLGDTTLTRLDIRYARTCKRVQNVCKNGVRDLVNWYCSEKNMVPSDFDVCMAKITTADDEEKARAEEADLNKVNTLLDMIERLSTDDDGSFQLTNENVKSILQYIVKDVYGDDRLSDMLFGEEEEKKREPGPIFESRESV